MVEILGKDTPDGLQIEKDIVETEKTSKELKAKLQEVIDKREQELFQVQIFDNTISELGDWIGTALETRVLKEPVARKPESIRKQINDIEVIP